MPPKWWRCDSSLAAMRFSSETHLNLCGSIGWNHHCYWCYCWTLHVVGFTLSPHLVGGLEHILFFHISEVDVTMHNTCHTRGPSMAPSATPATQKHTSRHNREHASHPRKRVRVTSEGNFRVTTEGLSNYPRQKKKNRTHGLPVLDHTPKKNEGVEAPNQPETTPGHCKIWRPLWGRLPIALSWRCWACLKMGYLQNGNVYGETDDVSPLDVGILNVQRNLCKVFHVCLTFEGCDRTNSNWPIPSGTSPTWKVRGCPGIKYHLCTPSLLHT